MSDLFLHFLNMGLTASWMILAVFAVRGLLRKMPKWVACLLWGMVAVRLMIPLSMESVMSLVPSAEPVPLSIALSTTPALDSGIAVVDEIVNPVISQTMAPSPANIVSPMEVAVYASAVIWGLGVAVMLVYGLITYNRMYWRVRVKLLLWDNVFLSDSIQTPFILGLFRPKIYIPSDTPDSQLEYIVSHERAHLARRDHWWKLLGFTVLSLHWYHPLVWVAYVLFCRDIESACDEKVVKDMCLDQRKQYSKALLDCSAPRKISLAYPVAFGEVEVKSRIRAVLRYKSPGFRGVALALALCILLGALFMTDPMAQAANLGVEKIGRITDFASFEAEMSKRLDLGTYRILQSSVSDGQRTTLRYIYQSKRGTHLPERISNHQIQVAGTYLGLPLTVEQMGLAGWTVTRINGAPANTFNVTQLTFEADLVFQNARGNILRAHVRHPIQNCMSRLTDCRVERLELPVQKSGNVRYPMVNPELENLTMFEGITHASTLDDIVAQLGYPHEMQFVVTVTERTGQTGGYTLYLTYRFGENGGYGDKVTFVIYPNGDTQSDRPDFIYDITYEMDF